MKNYRNKSWLEQRYLVDKLSSPKIGKLEKTGHSTILKYLRKFNIPIRSLQESHPLKFQFSKSFLYDEYWKKNKSFETIGKEHNVCFATVQYWFNRYKLPRRSPNDKSMFTGKNNHNWKGGQYINDYKYILSVGHPRSYKYRPYVPEQILVMEKELKRYLDKKEVVHHKDGIKLNNLPSNLQLFPDEKSHQTFEQNTLLFCKQLLFGSIQTGYRKELLQLFNKFINEQG
jgi:hypothetical protein